MDRTELRPHEDVLTFLLRSPSLDEVIAFRPSPLTQARIRALLAQNDVGDLDDDEQRELDEFAAVEHFMRLLKARARQMMASS